MLGPAAGRQDGHPAGIDAPVVGGEDPRRAFGTRDLPDHHPCDPVHPDRVAVLVSVMRVDPASAEFVAHRGLPGPEIPVT